MRRRDLRDDWPHARCWQGTHRRDDFDGNEYHRTDRTRMALVLGIVSLLIPPLGLVAWIVSRDCLKAIEDGLMDPSGETNARVGRLLAIIALCMFTAKVTVLSILYFFVF